MAQEFTEQTIVQMGQKFFGQETVETLGSDRSGCCETTIPLL
jgi:hypothetical protein